MSQRRKRVTVHYRPTGAGKTMGRMMGVFHAVFGTVFVLIALIVVFPINVLFGVLFLAGGAIIAVNGTMLALGKEGFLGRSYQIETETELEELTGVPVETSNPAPEQPTVEARLRQLEDLREKRLITAGEFEEKRKEILKEL